MEGIHYCPVEKKLQVRFGEQYQSLEELTQSFFLLCDSSKELAKAKTLEISICPSYYIGPTLRRPWRHLVQALTRTLPQLEALQIQAQTRPSMPFPFFQVGENSPTLQAFFPVSALRLLLVAFPQLTTLRLFNIQFTALSSLRLGDVLSNHTLSLCHFVWQHCNLPPSEQQHSHNSESLDPLWQALATIPSLESILVRMRHQEGTSPTVPSVVFENLAFGCPRLKKLQIAGMICCPPPTTTFSWSSLVEVEMTVLYLDSKSGSNLSQWLFGPANKLRSVTIHVCCRDPTKRIRLAPLQHFQNEFARSLVESNSNNHCLQKLHILCHGLAPHDSHCRPCVEGFRKALDVHPSLTSLSLPFCGEIGRAHV